MKAQPYVTTTPHGEDDALTVALYVPTYSGEVALTMTIERDADGDWRVFLPDTDDYDVHGGIVYLGSPEEPS